MRCNPKLKTKTPDQPDERGCCLRISYNYHKSGHAEAARRTQEEGSAGWD
jgi:hypothetical protein